MSWYEELENETLVKLAEALQIKPDDFFRLMDYGKEIATKVPKKQFDFDNVWPSLKEQLNRELSKLPPLHAAFVGAVVSAFLRKFWWDYNAQHNQAEMVLIPISEQELDDIRASGACDFEVKSWEAEQVRCLTDEEKADREELKKKIAKKILDEEDDNEIDWHISGNEGWLKDSYVDVI